MNLRTNWIELSILIQFSFLICLDVNILLALRSIGMEAIKKPDHSLTLNVLFWLVPTLSIWIGGLAVYLLAVQLTQKP